jgi:hypothetical protein
MLAIAPHKAENPYGQRFYMTNMLEGFKEIQMSRKIKKVPDTVEKPTLRNPLALHGLRRKVVKFTNRRVENIKGGAKNINRDLKEEE